MRPLILVRLLLKFCAPALLILLFLPGCDHEEAPPPPPVPGCTTCHPSTLDDSHAMACPDCHKGNDNAATAEAAHVDLVRQPAHPDRMMQTCGQCHKQIVKQAADSLHFTLKNEVNAVRRVFGARQLLNSLVEIPVHKKPATVLALADDLLRRRCLRCHVHTEGDPYPETMRGAGCAACHLRYKDGALQSHAFVKYPEDDQCLHCHYGNVIGPDYHGRYEHDFSREFRTPFAGAETFSRPYGVEFHQLAPDVHQTKGMSCIDCHAGSTLMGLSHGGAHMAAGEKLSCKTCHLWKPGSRPRLNTLQVEDGRLFLTTRLGGKMLPVPQLRHPAHWAEGKKAACVVCHAQWSYNDRGTHLMRHDAEDYDPFEFLLVQGSFEVEEQMITSLYTDEEYEGPVMQDKISGALSSGIWFKGYELRRWEAPLIGRDRDGMLRIFRPILDLHLSYVDEDEEVIFDSIAAKDDKGGLRPYSPHTIGKAGAFYKRRLHDNLDTYRNEAAASGSGPWLSHN